MERKYIEGFGSIFRKAFKRKHTDGTEYVYECRTWEIAYYHNGQELRESTHSAEEKDAIKLLKKRVQDLGRGVIGTREERVTFEQLTEDLKNDYKVNGRRSLRSIELSIRHLSEFFAGDRAVHITTDRIRAYIAERQEEEAAQCQHQPRAFRLEASLFPCTASRKAVSPSLHSESRRKQRAARLP